jgi:hypothetical protein
MQELKAYLVIFLAFVAFLLAVSIQGGGTWRGPHNLRKSLPSRGATIGMQGGRYSCEGNRCTAVGRISRAQGKV